MQDNYQKRVLALLQLPENQYCADCGVKNPKWASSKLGVFICLNCSGIHRSLGTHISFVRSVDLDVWKEEEAAMMEKVGNKIANEYWEALLPQDYQRPNTDDTAGMSRFIRQKYEMRKWADPNRPPPNEPRRRKKRKNPDSIQQNNDQNYQQQSFDDSNASFDQQNQFQQPMQQDSSFYDDDFSNFQGVIINGPFDDYLDQFRINQLQLVGDQYDLCDPIAPLMQQESSDHKTADGIYDPFSYEKHLKLIEEEEKLHQLQEEHLERERQHHLHKQRSPPSQQRSRPPQPQQQFQSEFNQHTEENSFVNSNEINASGSDDEREQAIRRNRSNPLQQQLQNNSDDDGDDGTFDPFSGISQRKSTPPAKSPEKKREKPRRREHEDDDEVPHDYHSHNRENKKAKSFAQNVENIKEKAKSIFNAGINLFTIPTKKQHKSKHGNHDNGRYLDDNNMTEQEKRRMKMQNAQNAVFENDDENIDDGQDVGLMDDNNNFESDDENQNKNQRNHKNDHLDNLSADGNVNDPFASGSDDKDAESHLSNKQQKNPFASQLQKQEASSKQPASRQQSSGNVFDMLDQDEDDQQQPDQDQQQNNPFAAQLQKQTSKSQSSDNFLDQDDQQPQKQEQQQRQQNNPFEAQLQKQPSKPQGSANLFDMLDQDEDNQQEQQQQDKQFTNQLQKQSSKPQGSANLFDMLDQYEDNQQGQQQNNQSAPQKQASDDLFDILGNNDNKNVQQNNNLFDPFENAPLKQNNASQPKPQPQQNNNNIFNPFTTAQAQQQKASTSASADLFDNFNSTSQSQNQTIKPQSSNDLYDPFGSSDATAKIPLDSHHETSTGLFDPFSSGTPTLSSKASNNSFRSNASSNNNGGDSVLFDPFEGKARNQTPNGSPQISANESNDLFDSLGAPANGSGNKFASFPNSVKGSMDDLFSTDPPAAPGPTAASENIFGLQENQSPINLTAPANQKNDSQTILDLFDQSTPQQSQPQQTQPKKKDDLLDFFDTSFTPTQQQQQQQQKPPLPQKPPQQQQQQRQSSKASVDPYSMFGTTPSRGGASQGLMGSGYGFGQRSSGQLGGMQQQGMMQQKPQQQQQQQRSQQSSQRSSGRSSTNTSNNPFSDINPF